jgi:TonB-dependent SusC/RagA subfamily outer membrane receptor
MKSILVFTVLLLCACSSSNVPRNPGMSEQARQTTGRVDLTNELRKLPGVIVRGSGANATFQVRGVNTVNSGTEPLFVLNGQPVQSYASIYDVVQADNFESARVLKEGESAAYGVRGANGVIVIKTKN